jgi:protein SCO1/2
MKLLRVIRWSATAGIVLLLAAIAVFEFAPGVRELVSSHSDRAVSASNDDNIVSVPQGVPIGGAFELTDDKRHTVTDADYRGRWMLVFFGYTTSRMSVR